MARLEDLTIGSQVRGMVSGEPVTVVQAGWMGSDAIDVTYKDIRGKSGSQIVFREDQDRLEVLGGHMAWGFEADADQLKLVSEAYRISLAHLFDPYLAVHNSSVEPLPHQISAVYQEMLKRIPLKYVLADDPGAGKTIMTGLYIKELMARGDLRRCLIVAPGSLVEQWQDELWEKFGLKFGILTNDRAESSAVNVFEQMPLCIARLDKLSRDEGLQRLLARMDWDLVVCDEAHKMSARVWNGEVRKTKRYMLGEILSRNARNFLLLTATPHNGKDEDFYLFMSLIDQDRFAGIHNRGKDAPELSDVMRRLVKEELFKFDGRPLFPERLSYTVNYKLSKEEARLYEEVTEYVRTEFNRAEKLVNKQKSTVGFALTVLQRRLASSPEAIYQSLRRRRERIEERLDAERLGQRTKDAFSDFGDEDSEDDRPAEEWEEQEEAVVDSVTAAETLEELEAELAVLKRLEARALNVRRSGVDRKWEELSRLLQDNAEMFSEGGRREKLIIFTEHRDTLNYLEAKIRSLLGDNDAVVTIHGGMTRKERRGMEERFKQDDSVRILVATDAAGEGINLQRAHLMINYDLPWNPNRLEQRFGRIHRIGQTEVCHLWNLVADETREGEVFQRLFQKLETEKAALGGKVFDILSGVTFNDKPLRDLLIEAVRYGDKPEVRARLDSVVDKALDTDALRKLISQNALTNEVMDLNAVNRIKEDMERMEAHRLQPFFIKSFFLTAFEKLGGQYSQREPGRYQLRVVPKSIRDKAEASGARRSVPAKYERVCFDKADVSVPGKPQAELITPGAALLDAVTGLVQDKYLGTLRQGAVFIDDSSLDASARLLFYIESSLQDGVTLPDGSRRIVSKALRFVEISEDGTASSAGYAPYLDYRPPDEEEKELVLSWARTQPWICSGVEDKARNYAVRNLVRAHLREEKAQREARLDKTEMAVRERLQAEIRYWDSKADELEDKERSGKKDRRQSAGGARQRAEELSSRLDKRLYELDQERNLSAMPPVIAGGALVIPKPLLERLQGKAPDASGLDERRRVERAAMEAVMALERRLGSQPVDVSRDNLGYDIESRSQGQADGPVLRQIEVKGRAKGADTVTVSRNEILTGLNKPDSYILAIVEVDGSETRITYLKHPFRKEPERSAVGVSYNIRQLAAEAEVIYQE